MKKLYFIRHGLSEMNVSGFVSGHTDTPLTDIGREQAKKAGKGAKDLGIDLIVSSPLVRALETAQIVAKEIGYPVGKIQTSNLLMERFYGAMEGQPYSPDVNMDGVADYESNNEMVERAHLALKWINTHEADHILVVSHGAFGRALRSIIKAEYPMSHKEFLNNAEIVAFIEEN